MYRAAHQRALGSELKSLQMKLLVLAREVGVQYPSRVAARGRGQHWDGGTSEEDHFVSRHLKTRWASG